MARRTFDCQELRGHLLADYGIPMLLGKPKSEANVVAWALACLSNAVQASLCGLDSEAVALAERSRDWLGEESTRHGPGHEHHVGLALATWLLTGELDQDALGLACGYLSERLEITRDKVEITHNLPVFLLARRHNEVRRIFDAAKILAVPTANSRVRCLGKMSYLIAAHELANEPDRRTLETVFQTFLKYQIPVCLHVNRSSLGTWGDVPIWAYLHGQYLQHQALHGVEAIRVALKYVVLRDSQSQSGASGNQ